MRLEAKEIYFRYGKRESWILENQNLCVEKGERVGIFAPSGFGKTTLALLLAGYLKPESGQILFNDKPFPKTGICPVQLICQHPEKAVNPRWKLKKVLEESGRIEEAMLFRYGIEPEWLGRYPRELSGGELQRFCIARALMSEPDFLICDEISTMLDVITQAQIWNQILEEAEKKNIGLIVVTHNKELAKRVCTRIMDLSEKKSRLNCGIER